MSTWQRESDLLFLNSGSILFHGTALLTILTSSLFSDAGDAISMAGAATILGMLADLGRMEISNSLGKTCKSQAEEYKNLQKEYDALQRKYEDKQRDFADKDISTCKSYEDEIRILKNTISELRYELYGPVKKYVHEGKSSFEVLPSGDYKHQRNNSVVNNKRGGDPP
ncbi:hypothetical protein TAMA11512_08810 [Selenomonas sp. TAMA-11512]|uniref:hypothetical protein n=1 Tax=Selenomonas sp. TAMA-11512 TaxID=3095337 RepID=UPI0030848D03|nr:hypothetical protein TAMA11512_08810 [Selenomonas sp. TAMA-11512]